MGPREAAQERARGARWVRDEVRPAGMLWELGDALVLGSFDWREWGFESRPSSAFLNGADEERIRLEEAA